MSKFYTNVQRYGNKILVRGYSDGVQFKEKINFNPSLYVTDNTKQSEIKSLDGKSIKEMQFDSIKEAREFIDRYDDVSGFAIYGNPAWQYQYISSTWTQEVRWDISQTRIYSMDIETTVEHKMKIHDMLKDPREQILLITLQDKLSKQFTVFTYKDYKIDETNRKINKVLCNDERELLIKFIDFFSRQNIDIITGWNTKFFDIPYIIGRIERVFGSIEYAYPLSPWKLINPRTVEINGNEITSYEISGISSLDYLDLYKKYIKTPRESYKLDHIAYEELKRNKVKNPTDSFKGFYSGEFDIVDESDIQEEFKKLHTLSYQRYVLRNKLNETEVDSELYNKLQLKYNEIDKKCAQESWNTFVIYNIIDTELVDQLEEKLKLIELQMTIAYFAKVNYEDIFGQVKVWETIIYNHLKDSNRIPSVNSSRGAKSSNFEGAFVKDPIVGKHKYIASFDLDSLYPHLIMQYNISPETLVNGFSHFQDIAHVERFLYRDIDTSKAKELNYSITANGTCYRNSVQGFLPELMESYYANRKKFKKQMLTLESENQINSSKELEYEISRLSNLQMALKILLNSLYGAVGNAGFKYFDLRIAEGITLSGQLSIRWIANRFNEFLNTHCKTENIDYVLAIDTDSNYINLERVVNQWTEFEISKGRNPSEEDKINFMDKFCEKVLQPVINNTYEELREYMNGYQQKMSMKRENLCDVGLFVAKKKYVLNVWDSEGVRYSEPKLKVVGLELVKSSTPELLRKKLKEIVPIILYKDNDELRNYITKFRKEFETLPVLTIAKPTGINDIEKYVSDKGLFSKGTPINVRAAAIYNNLVDKHDLMDSYSKIASGDKIKYVYLKMPNPIRQNVIGFTSDLPKQFELHDYIDYDTMFEKLFLSPVQIMAKPLNWSVDEESSLKGFF